MAKKGGNFFERHVEKIVLAVFGLISIWFLISRVLISPVKIEYAGKKFGPGEIDEYIIAQAEFLEDKINTAPEPKEPYKPRIGDFAALVESTVADIDLNIYPVQPNPFTKEVIVKSKYRLPEVEGVDNVAVEHIRAVAYVPTIELDEKNPYMEDNCELKDIDLVTVEAEVDVGRLYEKFYESFAGESVKQSWRDPYLAEPVFAAVQLQRQHLTSDGYWSDWEIVPRSRVEAFRKTLQVIEDISKLPAGGMEVRLLQFADPQVKADILQPSAYGIASAGEDWLPPSLHKRFLKEEATLRAKERQEKKEAKEKQRELAKKERLSRRERSQTTQKKSVGDIGGYGGGGGGYGGGPGYGGGAAIGGTSSSDRTRSERAQIRIERERELEEKSREGEKDKEDVYETFKKILIDDKTDFTRLKKPLLFWTHDDTVEPAGSYRYRIRYGLFNPVAGTTRLFDDQKSRSNEVILWSDFSDVTEVVRVPDKLYFFPIGIHESSKTAIVMVSRYEMGYWYSEDFSVKPGELLGKVVKVVPQAVEETDETEGLEEIQIVEPETIDYSTGAILVDIVPFNCWSSGKTMLPKYYFDMIYTFDGNNFEHIAIKQSNWPSNLQANYFEIKKIERLSKEPFRSWAASAGKLGQRRTSTGTGTGTGTGIFDFEGYGGGPGY